MTNDERMAKSKAQIVAAALPLRPSFFVIPSSFVIRPSSFASVTRPKVLDFSKP
jgi:hypothetical protein